jgi:hypothetical protein
MTSATGSKTKASIIASSIENIAEAMPAGAALIHGGQIAADDLLGDPDPLLRRSDRYVAGYIKSGHGEEGGEDDGDGRSSADYEVQIALYTDVLKRLRLSASHPPAI